MSECDICYVIILDSHYEYIDNINTYRCAHCNIKYCKNCVRIGKYYCCLDHLYKCIDIDITTSYFYNRIYECILDKKKIDYSTWTLPIHNEQLSIQNQINSVNVKQINFSYFELKRFLIKDLAKIVLAYIAQ